MNAFAFALLIALQFVVSWASVQVRWMRRLATGEPLMLLYCGEFLSKTLRKTRVTEQK